MVLLSNLILFTYLGRSTLTDELVGRWTINGTLETAEVAKLPVSGYAHCTKFSPEKLECFIKNLGGQNLSDCSAGPHILSVSKDAVVEMTFTTCDILDQMTGMYTGNGTVTFTNGLQMTIDGKFYLF